MGSSRLKPESFEPLISFLAFLVQELRKLPIFGKITNFTAFWPLPLNQKGV